MTPQLHPRRAQRGFLLIEGLVAILIFSLGILGMIAMAGTAVSAQSDAHYRTDAARLADDITNTIALSVNRADSTTIASTLAPFQHLPNGTDCNYTGTASGRAEVASWLNEVLTTGQGLPGLPGASATTQQILVATTAAGDFNRVQVTVCWRAPGTPNGTPMRRHTVVTYIN